MLFVFFCCCCGLCNILFAWSSMQSHKPNNNATNIIKLCNKREPRARDSSNNRKLIVSYIRIIVILIQQNLSLSNYNKYL